MALLVNNAYIVHSSGSVVPGVRCVVRPWLSPEFDRAVSCTEEAHRVTEAFDAGLTLDHHAQTLVPDRFTERAPPLEKNGG